VIQPAGDIFPVRIQMLVYTVAFFTANSYLMVSVVMPLWALELGASPLIIGLIISSRQILVVTLSIHGGALLDRFGPRGVLFLLGMIGAATMVLFPALPFVWAAIVIQMVSGFVESTSWIGAQSVAGRTFRGNPVYIGRMTAAARIGGFFGPWFAGLAWQFLGPAAGFGLIGVWMLCGGIAARFLPPPAEAASGGTTADKSPAPRRMPDVMPKISDYATTFRMLLLPAVALVIAVTFMRQTGSGIQNSFYGVWLKEIGFTAGTIGLLIGISNAASAVAALCMGPLTRLISQYWLLIVATIVAVISIAVTPLLGDFLLLAVAIALRGVGQGLNFPLMLAIASRAVGPHLQGRVVALRLTFNRLGGALVPLVMGAAAEVIGLEAAFYAVGAAGVMLLLLLGVWARRASGLGGGRAA